MTIELTILAWSVVLGLVHALATGMVTTSQFGLGYGLSPRDEKREATGVGARVQRAFANYMQTFPFFAAAVLVAHVAGRHSNGTVWGSELYLAARVLFVPLYAVGISGPRTLAYMASLVGIVMVLLALT